MSLKFFLYTHHYQPIGIEAGTLINLQYFHGLQPYACS